MEATTNKPEQDFFHKDPRIRFAWDNLSDAVKDKTLILWEVLDTKTGEKALMIGRLVKDKVLPLAILLPDSSETVARYAPAGANGEWEMSQIKS